MKLKTIGLMLSLLLFVAVTFYAALWLYWMAVRPAGEVIRVRPYVTVEVGR